MTIFLNMADRLIDGAFNRGGKTIWLTPRQITGYIVATKQYELVTDLDPDRALVTGWVLPLFNLNIDTLGSWSHENGIHFDVGTHYNNLDAALIYGKEQEQYSIWDLNNNCEIVV